MASLSRRPFTQFNLIPWPPGSAISPVQIPSTLDSCHQQVKNALPRDRLPCPAARKEDVIHLFQRVSLGLVDGIEDVQQHNPVH